MNSLEFPRLLLLFAKFWGSRQHHHIPLMRCYVGVEPRPSCLLGKLSNSAAAFPGSPSLRMKRNVFSVFRALLSFLLPLSPHRLPFSSAPHHTRAITCFGLSAEVWQPAPLSLVFSVIAHSLLPNLPDSVYTPNTVSDIFPTMLLKTAAAAIPRTSRVSFLQT